jgi:hypothetical protein
MQFKGPLLSAINNFIASYFSIDEIEDIFLCVDVPEGLPPYNPYEGELAYITKVIIGLKAAEFEDVIEAILREAVRREKGAFNASSLRRNKAATSLVTALDEAEYYIKDGEIVEIEDDEDLAKKAEEEQRRKFIKRLGDLGIYGKILSNLQNQGIGIETSPSIYQGKDEEALRDVLLLSLKGQFGDIASITGESFNKRGKTDILLKQNNTTLFVAECKIWSGEKHFQEAITQLFSYLTWRDTQAALIVFVQEAVISLIPQKIKDSIPNHPNYIKMLDEVDKNWINYRFHIDNDPGVEVALAFMIYHLPKLK